MQIKDVVEMQDGMIINGLRGVIKDLKEWEAPKETDQFPSSKQSFLFADSSGMQIWCNIKGRDAIPDELVGKQVQLDSYYDEKRKTWFGWKRSSFTDKTTGKLKIIINGSKTSKMVTVDSSSFDYPVEPPKATPASAPISNPHADMVQAGRAAQKEVITSAIKEAKLDVEMTKLRGIAISYAKDLVVADKLNMPMLLNATEIIVQYMINGESKKDDWFNLFGNGTKEEPAEQVESPEYTPTEEIPF